MTTQVRKPRLLIAGEFSSGKTQLITGLLNEEILPSNVTSTSLPPMWVSEDVEESTMVDLFGNSHPLPDLAEISVTKTAFCKMRHQAEILKHYDLIDTPGNSDPNIPPESWMRMLDCADVVVWCTNATQAWRQSEKAVWLEMKPGLCRDATLLITHGDRVIDERSRERLVRRVKRDSQMFFDHTMMVSLIEENDIQAIFDHLVGLAGNLNLIGADQPKFETHVRGNSNVRVRKIQVGAAPATAAEPAPAAAEPVVPAPVADPAPVVEPAPVAAEVETPVEPVLQPTLAEAPAAEPVIKTPSEEEAIALLLTEEEEILEAEEVVVPELTEEAATDAPLVPSEPVEDVYVDLDEDDTSARVMEVLGQEQNVLPFSKRADENTTPATKLWQSVSAGKDLDDVASWSDAVSALLKEVDKLLEEGSSSSPNDPFNVLARD